jgi:hypothetical protein
MKMYHQLTVKEYHDLWGNGSARRNWATGKAGLYHSGQRVSHIRRNKEHYQLQLSDGKTEILEAWELVTCDR